MWNKSVICWIGSSIRYVMHFQNIYVLNFQRSEFKDKSSDRFNTTRTSVVDDILEVLSIQL